jgi:hypothetical protein
MLYKINYFPITQCVPGVFVLPVETNLHIIALVCLILYFMPRLCRILYFMLGLCLDFATTRPSATVKHEERI